MLANQGPPIYHVWWGWGRIHATGSDPSIAPRGDPRDGFIGADPLLDRSNIGCGLAAGTFIQQVGSRPRATVTGMPNDNRSRVPVLWFDRNGCGPDHLFLEVTPQAALQEGPDLIAPASLGLRIRGGELVLMGQAMLDGGFMIDRQSVATLHQEIGKWLSHNPPVSQLELPVGQNECQSDRQDPGTHPGS